MHKGERCPKNPSMLKAHCSHCQGTELGTADNPKFSLKEGYYNGAPVVEVLKDGGPIHMYDTNFRFGVRKAQMVLACMDVLRKFWKSTETERLLFQPFLIESRRAGISVWVQVEMHPEFEHSSGTIINRPWLRLSTMAPYEEHLGLGTMKCRAVCALEKDLTGWLQRQGVCC